jgi:hypothetical protein
MAKHTSSQWLKLTLTGLVGVFMSGLALAAPEIRVTGNNILIPDGDSSPSVPDGSDFGALKIGSSPVKRVFVIINDGPDALNITGVNVTGAGFITTVSPQSVVASGGVASLEVQFTPTVAGTATGSISINNNDSDENPYNFTIQALVKSPNVRVTGGGFTITPGDSSPTTLDGTDFGTKTIGETVTRFFTINNDGDADLTVTNVAVGAGPFAVTGTVPTSVTSSGSAVFGISYSPVAVGQSNGTVTVSTDDPDTPSYTFQVNGTGIESEIDVRGKGLSIVSGDTTPSTDDGTLFPNTTFRSGETSVQFTIVNSGSGNLLINSLALSDSTNFRIEPALTLPASVNPSGSTTFTLVYQPTSAATHTTTVTLSNNDLSESTYTFAVSATSLAATMNFANITNGDTTPDSGDGTAYGPGLVGGTGINRNFQVSNAGPGDLIITSISINPSTHFSYTGSSLPRVVLAGNSIDIPIAFLPTVIGNHAAVVTVRTNDPNKDPFTFTVSGTGTQRSLVVGSVGQTVANGDETPSDLDGTQFGSLLVGGTPLSRTIQLRNTGNIPLQLNSLTSSRASEFSILSPSAVEIPAAGSVNLVIRFTPSELGARTSTITIASNDPSSPYTFVVGGIGAPRIAEPSDPPIEPEIFGCPFDSGSPGDFTGAIYEDDGKGKPSGVVRGGFDSFRLTNDGSFTAKGNIDGADITLKGKLGPDGNYSGSFTLSDKSVAVITFQHYKGNDGSVRIIGTLVRNGETLHIDVIRSGAVALPASLTGRYTMLIPAVDSAPPTEPHGDGMAFLTLRIDGNVRSQFILGDGTQITRSTKVSPRYVWQFQSPVYREGWKTGFFAGRMTFREVAGTSDFDGPIYWKRAAAGGSGYYPGGFAIQRTAVGAKYVEPSKGRSAMPGLVAGNNNAEFWIGASAEGVPAQAVSCTWTTDDKISNQTSPKLNLKINRKTGQISGFYTDSTSRTRVSVYAAILQKQSRSGGLFKGYNITGFVTLAPKGS